MFKFVALLALIANVAAFAPASMRRMSSAMKMTYESEAGVTSPLGYFDPLGIL